MALAESPGSGGATTAASHMPEVHAANRHPENFNDTRPSSGQDLHTGNVHPSDLKRHHYRRMSTAVQTDNVCLFIQPRSQPDTNVFHS